MLTLVQSIELIQSSPDLHALSCVCIIHIVYSLNRVRLFCDFPGKNTGVGCYILLRVIFPTGDQTHVSCTGRQVLYHWATWEVLCMSAAAAAKSCLTLCDPIDGSPSGSAVPAILQARTLEWVAISFSSAWKWKVKVKSFSRVWLLATPWPAAYQAPPSMEFSRQECWSGESLPIVLCNCITCRFSNYHHNQDTALFHCLEDSWCYSLWPHPFFDFFDEKS